MLEGEAFVIAETEIINLVEIGFGRHVVDVVFVRREARPIATGRVDLDHHQFVGREGRGDYIDDLARGVAAAAQVGGDVFRLDEARLVPSVRRYTAFGDLADRLSGERNGLVRRQIESV